MPDVKFGADGATEAISTTSVPQQSDTVDPSAFRSSQEHALPIKAEVVGNITKVFDRIEVAAELDVQLTRQAVSLLVDEMLKDARALLSLTQLKNADSYTFTHSVNVSILAVYLAMHAGLLDDIERIGAASLVHDIGKTRTPESILRKRGPMTAEERRVMYSHPQLGVDILKTSSAFEEDIIAAVLDHHEKCCGIGYPNRKLGEQISPYAKVIAIADVYDALTTDRPYRKALNPRDAMQMMTGYMSKGFDDELLQQFSEAVGHYPVGSRVRLSNGWAAVVIRSHPTDPLRPVVAILKSPEEEISDITRSIDLRNRTDIAIERFTHEEYTPFSRAA